MNRLFTVSLPAPHLIGAAGPEWMFRGVWGDHARLVGIPEMDGEIPLVALHVFEDADPWGEATMWMSPATARGVAGALLAAADHSEAGERR